jgi:protein-disulfide isomerase
MQQIIIKNEGKVAWVYRHFPIASLHPKAFHEAEATECAFEQGGNTTFWKYTNELYARTESNNKLDIAELPKIAEYVGLDLDLFNTCLASGKYAEKIESDITDGQNAGVRGTPTSFIVKNGKVIDMIQGSEPYETLNKRIENLLQ